MYLINIYSESFVLELIRLREYNGTNTVLGPVLMELSFFFIHSFIYLFIYEFYFIFLYSRFLLVIYFIQISV